ncbi:MAG: MAC/perforin domain-containing protein [Eubacteriales bacterium]|nr:MAC/perforin domain-containing protein [Eubacteriales bacterium]MDD4422421.1 MAC/perforin domain-containing protein [Eubacteriales bacterium]
MKKIFSKVLCLLIVSILALFSLISCENNGSTTSNDSSVVSDTTSELSGEYSDDVSEEEYVKDEVIISEEEKQGVIAEGLLGVTGNKVFAYNGYLGYGYNLLEASYYNPNDIKATNPIIDMDKLAADGYVYVNGITSNSIDCVTFMSDSTKEYSKSISISANLEGKFGLTGSFKTSFGMDYSSEIKSNQKLITVQSSLFTQRDFIYDTNNEIVGNYATSAFTKDAEKLSPEALIKKYGTHVLKDIFLGGRFDLNYLYTNIENKSDESISASVSASYGRVSGGATVDIDERRKEVEKNSKLLIRAYGGSVVVDPTSIEKAQASYEKWAQGVEDGKITLVDSSEIVGIWDIVAKMDFANAEAKSKEIEDYFNSRSGEIAAAFKKSASVKMYIASIHVGTGDSEMKAKNVLRQQGILEGNIINLDLNRSCGGDYIYVGYKTTNDSTKALTGICADYFNNANSSNIKFDNCDYTIIPIDLNKGAGGKYIYLYYTHDTKAGNPITGIQYQDNNRFENGNADGYEVVRCTTDKQGLDLNKESGGDYIYLWFTRK